MNSELIIDVKPKEVSMAVLEDGELVELRTENRNIRYAVGDILLGEVDNVVRGNNAAFVNIGPMKNGFLHYNDLGKVFGATTHLLEDIAEKKKVPPIDKVKEGEPLPKDGNIINSGLKKGDKILVKVTREAFGTKGPSLSAELSIAGRFLVLVPFSDQVAISSEIRSTEERTRLKTIVYSVIKSGYGAIIRTQAAGKKTQELVEEMMDLIDRFETSIKKLVRAKAPTQIYEERNRAINLIRDSYNKSFTKIVVNDPDYYKELRGYVADIDPGREQIVTLYEDDAKRPLFDACGVTKQKKTLFGRKVTLRSGANIIIEQTEAMHVIDVNSSKKARRTSGQEETAFDVNMAVADLIARQIRLRDLGGIIVIDFIDMNEAAHNKELYEHMVKLMANDRATHKILPLSKFGLMQITRQRVRQATIIRTEETCPTCQGTGKIKTSITFTDDLEEMIAQLTTGDKPIRNFAMHLHPYVVAYIKKAPLLGSSLFTKWKKKYSKNIKLIEDQDVALLDCKIYDKDRNLITLEK
ncbi:Rne/Rng family ribonuclease [Porphyromonas uenonis]